MGVKKKEKVDCVDGVCLASLVNNINKYSFDIVLCSWYTSMEMNILQNGASLIFHSKRILDQKLQMGPGQGWAKVTIVASKNCNFSPGLG